MTRVKVCGVTNEDDARAAAGAGAWAIGMILSPVGPRALDRARAQRVRKAIPDGVLAVGVLVDEAADTARRLARELGLDLVQLHGAESPEIVDRLPVPAIKAFPVEVAPVARALATWSEAFAALVDAKAPGFAWEAFADGELRAALPSDRLIVAGGLDAANVGSAIARARPFAVDVSRGVEASPGIKDRAKIEAFLRAVESS
jgi:phosphoribosylanthranilate isomerase